MFYLLQPKTWLMRHDFKIAKANNEQLFITAALVLPTDAIET